METTSYWNKICTGSAAEHGIHVLWEVPATKTVAIGRASTVEPESIEPADCNGLKEDSDKEGEAGRVVLQQVEDVEPALEGG